MIFDVSNPLSAFDTQASGFSQANAWVLAQVARMAYESQDVVTTISQEIWQFPGFRFFEGRNGSDTDTQGFVIADDDTLIITFRGTENKEGDYATNLDVDLIPLLGGNVHEGFWQATQIVWEQVKDAINFLRTQNQKIWLCGHSLGGALATLATAQLLDEGLEISGLYTFGQPRVGDAVFAQTMDYIFKDKYFRLVNHGDAVTRQPTKSMGYQHAGTFVFLTEDGQITIDDSTWLEYWQNYGSSIADWLDMAIGDVPEHNTQAYIDKLQV